MKTYNTPFFSEMKYIKNLVKVLSDERLAFLDGERLGDLDILGEDPAVCRKVRRILEKRVCQQFWRNASRAKRYGNRSRFETKHILSNQFRNIFGCVPEESRISA